MMPGVLTSGVLIFALSKAATTTIVNLVIWGVVFPALVTGLIALAVIRAIGERQENDDLKRHRRRT
jgi:K+-transporting ATPase c subunit